MKLWRDPPALYAAFDRFPSAKGAAVHIDRFARTLFEVAGGGLLHVLGDADLPEYQREDGVEILRFSAPIPNLLQRALSYTRHLESHLRPHDRRLQLCHVRDPWSAEPLLRLRRPGLRLIYEVNGLPSIEWPQSYPSLSNQTLAKLRTLELDCLAGADLVLTPSRCLAARLRDLGVVSAKIRVIPNGADLPADEPVSPAPWPYILYFGALQPWQGLETLLQAVVRLQDFHPLRLVICASVAGERLRAYQRLAERLGLRDRVHWEVALSQAELAPWRRHALVSVAPLSECARNLDQGCCPLKILESMAAGVPVVASDLPTVREILVNGEHGRLVPPDRPAELARAIRLLLEYPERRQEMGRQARQHIAEHFTWERALTELRGVYLELGLQPSADERSSHSGEMT